MLTFECYCCLYDDQPIHFVFVVKFVYSRQCTVHVKLRYLLFSSTLIVLSFSFSRLTITYSITKVASRKVKSDVARRQLQRIGVS